MTFFSSQYTCDYLFLTIKPTFNALIWGHTNTYITHQNYMSCVKLSLPHGAALSSDWCDTLDLPLLLMSDRWLANLFLICEGSWISQQICLECPYSACTGTVFVCVFGRVDERYGCASDAKRSFETGAQMSQERSVDSWQVTHQPFDVHRYIFCQAPVVQVHLVQHADWP